MNPDPIALVSLPSTSTLDFPEALDRGCDIVLLVDGSEAMARADPSAYWKGALKLFISLLEVDDRVGIISFRREATEQISLTQNIEQNRPALFNAIERIAAEGTAANVYDAVQKGFRELRTLTRRYRDAVSDLVGVRQTAEELKQKFAAVSRDAARAAVDTPGSRVSKSSHHGEEGELDDLRTKLGSRGSVEEKVPPALAASGEIR